MKPILIGAPTSDAKDYCFEEWISQVESFTYPDSEIFIVDNSKDKNHVKKFHEKGIEAEWCDPSGMDAVEFITKSQNIIRAKAMAQGRDLFSLETDIFCKPDIIQQLQMYDVPVVSALYFLGQTDDLSTNIQIIESKIDRVRQVRLASLEEAIPSIDGTLKQVWGCGLGCCLIGHEILVSIPFKAKPDGGDTGKFSTFSDTLFYADLEKLDVPAYVDTTITVDHKRTGWDANPELMKTALS